MRHCLVRAFSRRHCRRGLTITELLVAVAIMTVLAGVLLPAVLATREASRRTGCLNNLKEITLGQQNYVQTFRVGPPARKLPQGLAGVLEQPFLDQDSATPAVWRCPADRQLSTEGVFSYLAGDDLGAWGTHAGAVDPRPLTARVRTPLAVIDGTSQTVLFTERRITEDNMAAGRLAFWQVPEPADALDVTWYVPTAATTLGDLIEQCESASLTSYLPAFDPLFRQDLTFAASNLYGVTFDRSPNSVSCYNGPSRDTDPMPGFEHRDRALTPASSRHAGGVGAAFFDGSARFISDAIDPALWRATGTAIGHEPPAAM